MNDYSEEEPKPKFPTKLVVGGGLIGLLVAFLFSRRGKGGWFDGGGSKNRITGDIRRLLAAGDQNTIPTIDVRVLDRGAVGSFLFVKPGDTEGFTINGLVEMTKGKVDGKELQMVIRMPGNVLAGNVDLVRNRLKAESIPFLEQK